MFSINPSVRNVESAVAYRSMKFYFSCVLFTLVTALTPLANAHKLNTTSLVISNPDDENENPSFVLLDPGGFNCPTVVTVTVDPDTALKVSPSTPIEVTGSQLFVVSTIKGSGVIPLEVKIKVKWKHGDAPMVASDPCYRAMDAGEAAEGEEEITVTVSDILTAFNESQANKAQAAQAGDPINTESGELFFTENADLKYFYQPMPLEFRRYYAAHLRRWLVVGRMGDNWRHNFEWTLRNVGNTLQVVDHFGRQTKYLKTDTTTNDWTQQNNSDVPLEVIQTTDGKTIWAVLDPRSGYTYVFSVPGALSEFKLTSIEDGKGNVQTLSYDADGLLIQVSDSFGRAIRIAYDPTQQNPALKKVSRITDNGARAVVFAYENDNLTTVLDANNRATKYVYDTAHADPGLMLRKVWPNGNSPWRQTFDDRGRVKTQTDSFGNVSSFTYEEINGKRTTVTRPDGLTEVHEHSAAGALTKSTDANNNTSVISNTATTARNKVTSPNGGSFASTYDSISGKVASETFAGGQTTSYSYITRTDSRGFTHRELTTITYPDGSTQKFSYDGNGNRLSKTNQDGYTTSFQYDGFGHLTKSTNPLGGTTTHAYDQRGNPLSTTDPAGNTTTFEYDGFDRLLTVTRADGATRKMTYDVLNRQTSLTLESGGTTSFAFDANGNLLTLTDPSGKATTSAYDGNNNLVKYTDRAGVTTTYTYDNLNRISKSSTSDGREEIYTYDATGELESIRDGAGRTNSLVYDSIQNLSSSADNEGNKTTYSRDKQGQITSSTTPSGDTTTYEYDPLGRMVKVTLPSGRTTTNTFEKSGWIKSITLQGGASTLMERNGLGQIERFTSSNGGVWRYEYDTSGRVTSSTDPIGNVINHTYDSRNRVSRTTYPGNLGGVNYTYNAYGHITTRAWDSGPTINDAYDALGRLISTDAVTIGYDSDSRIISANGITTARDAAGRVTEVTVAPGKTVSYSYDSVSGDLVSATDWSGNTTTIEWDSRRNVSRLNRGNSLATTFSYDVSGRSKAINHGFSSLEIIYNNDGQISAVNRSQALAPALPDSLNYTYDAADRIVEFEYDALGRVTNDGKRAYTYDGASRLIGVVAEKQVSYQYNGFGHIVKRTEGANTREYVWNHTGKMPVISIIRDNGVDTRYFAHTPSGRLLYSIDAVDNSRLYYHFDERGNTVALSNDAGDVVTTYAYGPYGTITTSAEIDNPFTFAGIYGVISDTLGFYHMQRRVMDPANGRFLTPEPVMPLIYPQNSIYGYAANDPINNIDPSGTTPTRQEAARAAASTQLGIAGIVGDLKAGKAQSLQKAGQQLIALANSVGSDAPADINAVVKAVVKGEKALETADDLRKVAAPLQSAGKVGVGLQVLDIAITMKKLHDEVGKATEDFDAATKGALKSYRDNSRSVVQIYRKKNKSLDWLQKMLKTQHELFREQLRSAGTLHEIEVALDSLVAFANGLGSFVPGFTGIDPDAGNNVGFLFF